MIRTVTLALTVTLLTAGRARAEGHPFVNAAELIGIWDVTFVVTLSTCSNHQVGDMDRHGWEVSVLAGRLHIAPTAKGHVSYDGVMSGPGRLVLNSEPIAVMEMSGTPNHISGRLSRPLNFDAKVPRVVMEEVVANRR